jgi:hypothetical protein
MSTTSLDKIDQESQCYKCPGESLVFSYIDAAKFKTLSLFTGLYKLMAYFISPSIEMHWKIANLTNSDQPHNKNQRIDQVKSIGGARCRRGVSIPCRSLTPAVSPISRYGKWLDLQSKSVLKKQMIIETKYNTYQVSKLKPFWKRPSHYSAIFKYVI